MNNAKQKISPVQLFFFTLMTQIGIAVFTLPSDEVLLAGNDAWLSVLAAGLLVNMNIIIIWLLHRRFPSLTVFEIMDEAAGLIIGFVLKAVYILYFVSIAAFIVILFGRMVSIWILPSTPVWISNFILVTVCAFGVKENIRVMARFFVVVSILLVLLLFFITSIIPDASFISVLPVGNNGLSAILQGMHPAIVAFLGYELLLIAFAASLGSSIAKLKSALLANCFTTLFYAYLTFVSIIYLGPYAMKYIPEPVLYIMKYRSFSVFERTDLLFFSIWVVCVGTSFMTYLYSSATGIANLLKKSYSTMMVCLIAAFIFALVCFAPTNDQFVHIINQYVLYLCYPFIAGFPLILLVLSVLRGKKETPGAI